MLEAGLEQFRLAQAERGEGVDGDLFMQGLIDDLDAREKNNNAG